MMLAAPLLTAALAFLPGQVVEGAPWVGDGGVDEDGGALDDADDADGGALGDGGALASEDLEGPPEPPEKGACDPKKDKSCTIRKLIFRIVRGHRAEEVPLRRVLKDILDRPTTDENLRLAEKRLRQLKRYTAVACSYEGPEPGTMTCGLFRQRTIRRVNIEGLSWRLLDTDVRKRVFLRGGEILPAPSPDAEGWDRMDRQERRIVEYLERKGFYGAQVEISAPKQSEESEIDVTLKIRSGAFVGVRNVDVKDPGPLDPGDLVRSFSRMCWTPDGWLDAFETFTPNCLTRDQLGATRDSVETRLRKLGYPEARVRVLTRLVDQRTTDDESCRWDEEDIAEVEAQGLPVPPLCADLEVTVFPGPRLQVEVVFVGDTPIIDDVATLPSAISWLQAPVDFVLGLWRGTRTSMFEPVSRMTQVVAQDDVDSARDSDIFLSDILRSYTFEEARSADAQEAEATRQRIEESLARRGHFNARVTVRYEAKGLDEVHVRYEIHPGPVAAVTRVTFSGNELLTEEEVRGGVTLATRPRPDAGGLGGAYAALGSSGYFSPRQLEEDADRITAYYESRGFQEASVQWRGYRLPGGGMEVRFEIEEGPRYVISRVDVEGGVKELWATMFRSLELCKTGYAYKLGRDAFAPQDCKGSAFLVDELEADRRRILNIYAANGYPYTTADIDVVGFDAEGALLLIRIVSSRDPEEKLKPAHVGIILLDGNERTDREVLLREAAFDEKTLRPVQISEGLTRLRKTGLFSRVEVEYIGVDEKRDDIHLRLKVEERPAITWDGSVAFSTNRFFSVRNEFRDRNFLGRMLEVSALADLGLFIGRYTQVQTQLRWPRFFGLPFGFKLTGPGVIYEDRPSAFLPRSPTSGGPVRATASWFAQDLRRRNLKLFAATTFDYKLFSDLDWVVGVDYEFRFEWDNATAAPIEPFSVTALTTVDGITSLFWGPQARLPQRVSLITPWTRYRSIDNPFNPRKGWTGEASFAVGTPVINGEYLGLLQLNGTWYQSVWRLTFALHGRTWGGWAWAPDGVRKSTLLQQNLVAVGGDRTVRGYLQDRIGVSELVTAADLGRDVSQAGHIGIFGGVANAELRVLLFKDLFVGDLNGAVFTDVGVVTNNDPALLPFNDLGTTAVKLLSEAADPAGLLSAEAARVYGVLFDRNRPRLGLSVGAGLRYVLPVGPLSLDFACSVLDRPTPERCAWHLQLGYAF